MEKQTWTIKDEAKAIVDCWLCLRIKPSDVAKAVHKLPLINDKQAAHKIVIECINLIKKTYAQNRTVFCGKTKLRIIGGLLYYVVNIKYASYIDEPKRKKNYCKWFDMEELSSHYRLHWLTQREIALYLLEPDEVVDWGEAICAEHTVRAGYRDWKKCLEEER